MPVTCATVPLLTYASDSSVASPLSKAHRSQVNQRFLAYHSIQFNSNSPLGLSTLNQTLARANKEISDAQSDCQPPFNPDKPSCSLSLLEGSLLMANLSLEVPAIATACAWWPPKGSNSNNAKEMNLSLHYGSVLVYPPHPNSILK